MKTYCLKMIILLDLENIADSLKEAIIQPRKATYLSRCLSWFDFQADLPIALHDTVLTLRCAAALHFLLMHTTWTLRRAIHKPCTVWSKTRSETSYLKDISQLWLQPIKSLQKQKITFLMEEALTKVEEYQHATCDHSLNTGPSRERCLLSSQSNLL